jgi:uncharacterized protein (DUF433 family)
MIRQISAEPVPLVPGDDGVIRVKGSRVTLETIVGAFNRGATPEEIAQQYDAVSLPDIYAVITYYLRHRTDVDDYVAKAQREAQQVRDLIEAQFPPNGIRERLLARQASKADGSDASSSSR